MDEKEWNKAVSDARNRAAEAARKGLSREWFEKIAGPGVVEAFDRSHGLTVAMCGPKCDHNWTGPEVAIENGSSVSCAKCGMLAIDHDRNQ